MPDTRRFEFHVAMDLDAKIDAWRRQQPDLPNRSKAARLLIQRGLEADAPAAPAAALPKAKALKDAPWRAESVQPDRTIACNVQINEPLDVKMKWLLKRTERGKREFVEAAFTEYVAQEMARLGVKP